MQPTRVSGQGRRSCVQVFAKGKRAFRSQYGVPNASQIIKNEPPTPEVDPENAEFVIFARMKNYIAMAGAPPSDSPWVPLSIVKGGASANLLVKSLETEWGRKLFAKTLIRNIALAVYKDRAQIEKELKTNYPGFKGQASKEFEFAFKVRDKTQPKEWYKAANLTMCPKESALAQTPIDALTSFFSPSSITGTTP